MNLIMGVVMLSQRRNPRLQLVKQADAHSADVFLLDSGNRETLDWVQQNPWIHEKGVVWVKNSPMAQAGETVLRPPVHWSQLAFIIANALEEKDTLRASVGQSKAAEPDMLFGAPSEPAQASAQKVLVVDDSLGVRNHLRSLLESYKLEVSDVADGETAIAASSAFAHDCILLDVLMPGMDGYETCRKIKAAAKAEGHNPPIIMLTSKSSPFDRIRGKMSGCDAYLTKPVKLSDLMAELSKHVKLT